ncbi:plasmid mobilization relaxosome protein MobC [Lachnospiraceae bacterium]|nr:plasmid mobilization relaxosome protein MobC [Lachnospiraceae bacterium]
MRILRRSIERPLPKRKEWHMARPKGENVIRKHFKLTEETAKLLAECSKAENMNESEYIRYLLLNQSENPRSRELELEIMRLRNEVNKIGRNINQIVKNSNSHIYKEDDKIKLILEVEKIKDLLAMVISRFV